MKLTFLNFVFDKCNTGEYFFSGYLESTLPSSSPPLPFNNEFCLQNMRGKIGIVSSSDLNIINSRSYSSQSSYYYDSTVMSPSLTSVGNPFTSIREGI